MAMSNYKKQKDYDIGAVEADYRNSTLTLREIARRHGISHATIIGKAKKHAWVRNPDAASMRARYSVEVEQSILQSARIEAVAQQKSLSNKIRDLAHMQLDQVRRELNRRDREARGFEVKTKTGRPSNLTKTMQDCAKLLADLVKIEAEIFKQENLPPPAPPGKVGDAAPAAAEGDDAGDVPVAAAPAAPISLAERLRLDEHEEEIRKAQAEHQSRRAAPAESEPAPEAEKVVPLGSHG